MKEILEALPAQTLLFNGKYRIDGVISQGGMGITYKATLLALDVQVSVKELFLSGKCTRLPNGAVAHHALSDKRYQTYIQQFATEGRALAKFKHPNLVSVRDIAEENNTVYLVMDYVEERNLEDYVYQKGILPLPEALSYITQVAGALHEIHSSGLLHKDVRPRNIYLNAQGKAILMGLGSSNQFIDNTTDNTAPNYTPIEQYIAQFTNKDHTGPYTDVYALAATLYFCLTQKHPISAVERQNTQLAPPQTFNAVLNPVVTAAILKGMAMNYEERYASVLEFTGHLPQKTGQANQQPYEDALPIGTMLQNGKFAIEEVISRNNMGFTYAALQIHLALRVQIAELFPLGLCSRNSKKQLQTESKTDNTLAQMQQNYAQRAKLLAKLHSPHLPKVLDVVHENNTVYVITEWIEGQTLEEKIQQTGALPEKEALNIILQVARAVTAAHSNALLHHHICPANIILSQQRGAVLTDWALHPHQITEEQNAYAPLELYSSKSTPGVYTDVYSLGAVLYYALSAIPPAGALDRQFQNLPLLKKIAPSVHPVIGQAVHKAMSEKEQDRYESAAAFAAQLQGAYVFRQQQRKKRVAALVILASVLLFSGLAWVWSKQEIIPNIPPSENEKYATLANDLLQKGNYSVSASYYKAVLKNDPQHTTAINGLRLAQAALQITPRWWKQLDPNWQNIFRQAAGFEGQPTTTDFIHVAQLRQLHCYNTPVSNLWPVQHLLNLEVLYCDETKITSLEPIKELHNLRELACFNTGIGSLEPIAALTRLQVLDCSGTQVSDIAPLKNLTALEELYIGNTLVTNLQPVSGLVNLRQLHCYNLPINNLQPIQGLSKLEKLQCYKTQINSLEPIANLNNLKELQCYKTQISSLQPLSGLKNLQLLYCYDTPINSLEPLAVLPNLLHVYCSNTAVHSLEPLRNLYNLEKLNCYNTLIASVAPLSQLHNLKQLNCSSTLVDNLTPLAGLNNLTSLYFSKTKVTSLQPLRNLRNLNILYCYATQIADLSAISDLQNLHELHLENTQVNSLEAIKNLTNIEKLYCSGTQINSLLPLQQLRNLQLLHCANTQVNNLNVLETCLNLKEIDFSETPVASLAALNNLQNLAFVKCSGTKVSPTEMEQFKRQHSSCAVEY